MFFGPKHNRFGRRAPIIHLFIFGEPESHVPSELKVQKEIGRGLTDNRGRKRNLLN